MKSYVVRGAIAACVFALGATAASAGCVNKGAVATSDSEKNAKWYAMETMVQAVSWGLWPGWLQNGKVEGYRVTSERYRCSKDAGGVTCHGRATFCTTK